MRALTETKKSKKSKKSSSQAPTAKTAKREKAARQHLRAIDEEGAASASHLLSQQQSDPTSESDRAPGHPEVFTQEHIVQLFDGDLDEFAALDAAGSREPHHRRVQYVVENEVSGDFFRVRGTHQRRKHGDDGSHFAILSRASTRFPFRQLGSEDPLASREVSEAGAASLRDLETALVVMCQGILTGLCWMDAFNLSSSAAFACAYSAEADRSRQLFFVLFKYPSPCAAWRCCVRSRLLVCCVAPYIGVRSTVSLLGLMKKLGRLASERDAAAAAQDWEEETPRQRQLRRLSSRLVRQSPSLSAKLAMPGH